MDPWIHGSAAGAAARAAAGAAAGAATSAAAVCMCYVGMGVCFAPPHMYMIKYLMHTAAEAAASAAAPAADPWIPIFYHEPYLLF